VQLQFEHRSRSIIGLIDSLGDQHEADAYVLAAGAQTPILGKRAHVRIPIVPVKGYSISIISDGSNLSPLIPVTDAALHIAVTPLDHGRLRIAGTAELAGYDRSVRPERVKMLRRVFGQMYPHLICDWSAAIAWAGLRPVTPDGVPIISRTLYGNLFLNCGHGHLGWTLCAASGELMAAIVMGEGAHLTQEHYALTRF
jgi:D-amino-acid dehydrogenase